ncbi:hypothetical protein VMCG_09808 [Cytospora schulzeri]|uniref:Uncharacterized protein n=1 Tax=Cytospora schulzeri TaxID=448051 RepID=A0A423VHR6_9PEZI|nr:hypothetical protein VMCG_09808 [Valsa malicola]
MAWWIALSTADTLALGRVFPFLTGQPLSREAAAALRQVDHISRPGFGTVSPRTVYIPGNAFNAGTAFTSFFAATAIVGDVLVAKAADDLKKMSMYAPDIRGELGAQVTAMIQGWPAEGFGAFIYNFLRQEIDDYGGEASVGRHAFYVYNPTTSADVVFKEKVRNQPLPPSFGGFSSDIEAIFRLMWTNRLTLRDTMSRDAADAVVFHLLVPAMSTIAVLDRMVIGGSVGRLVIKGHMEEGSCYAWFNFVRLPRQF